MAQQPYVSPADAPKLPNGNVLIPRGATAHQKRSLAPMSPSTSLNAPQKSWISDKIDGKLALALAPLLDRITALEARCAALEGGAPPAAAASGKGGKKAAVPKAGAAPQAPAETKPAAPAAKTEAPTTSAGSAEQKKDDGPATGDTGEPDPAELKFSAPMMGLLATIKDPTRRREVVKLFKQDKPEATKMAEARGLIGKWAKSDRDAERLGAISEDE